MDKQDLAVQINVAAFEFGLPGAADRQKYIEALRSEIETVADDAERFTVTALCLTGANPFQYSGSELAEVIKTLRKTLPFQPGAEFTLNAVPGSLSYADLMELRKTGATRVSFDETTFVQSELDSLGRAYSPRSIEVFSKMVALKMIFFDFDVTLRYGIPGQTPESLVFSLEQMIKSHCSHLTLLPFEGAEQENLLLLYQTAMRLIGETNFQQYTPHHFGRPKYLSRWGRMAYSTQPRMGFGVGVNWTLDGMLCRNTADIPAYLASGGDPAVTIASMEALTPERSEAWNLLDSLYNLKTSSLPEDHPGLGEQAQALVERGFLEMQADGVRLSLAGLANWPAVDAGITH